MDIERAQNLSEGLRDLADWIDRHSTDLEQSDLSQNIRLLMCRIDRDEFVASVPLLEGQYEVDTDTDTKYLALIRWFGPVGLHLYIEKAKVGERVERMRPATDWELDPDVAAAITPEAVA